MELFADDLIAVLGNESKMFLGNTDRSASDFVSIMTKWNYVSLVVLS